MRDLFFTTTVSLILTPLLLAGMGLSFAQVMQSSNYRIESDSINFGGGLSTSTNYALESTAGEVATGESESSSFKLKAGYQQMHEVFISMSAPDNVTLTPSIPGITGGTSNGSTTVTVITDSPAGYYLTIQSSNSPAMQKGGDAIADYVPLGDPDFTFTTNTTDAHFGYSPSGVDIVERFRDDTNACNSGSDDTPFACWDGLSLSPVIIAQSAGANHPNGATTTLYFRVGIGGSVGQPSGTYSATTTLTALPL
jgi:hypothetical protein